MSLKGRMQLFAEARAQGLGPEAAAGHAGYSQTGIRVTASRLESRADVQKEIRRLKKGGPSPRDEMKAALGVEDNELDKWGMKDHYNSPLDLLKDVYNNPKAPKSLRYQAAKDALPYCHARKESGKKDETANEAKKAGAKGSRFGQQQRPSHLSAVVN